MMLEMLGSSKGTRSRWMRIVPVYIVLGSSAGSMALNNAENLACRDMVMTAWFSVQKIDKFEVKSIV